MINQLDALFLFSIAAYEPDKKGSELRATVDASAKRIHKELALTITEIDMDAASGGPPPLTARGKGVVEAMMAAGNAYLAEHV